MKDNETNKELSYIGFINGYNINIMRIETLMGENKYLSGSGEYGLKAPDTVKHLHILRLFCFTSHNYSISNITITSTI